MKVTYMDILDKVRCPFQFHKEICFPGCGCSAEKSCWQKIVKEVDEQELKELIDNCKHIIKVEK